MEEEKTLSYSFYEVHITLITNADRQYKKRKLWTNIPHAYKYESFLNG